MGDGGDPNGRRVAEQTVYNKALAALEATSRLPQVLVFSVDTLWPFFVSAHRAS